MVCISVKVSLHDLISGNSALRNIREQAFARLGVSFGGSQLITVCGNERGFMYAFSCSRQPPI